MEFLPVLKGFDNLSKILKTESIRHEKALQTAIKVEGYRAMRLLKNQIQQGSPGGRKFRPLTFLARMAGGSGRLKPDKRLKGIGNLIRYKVLSTKPFSLAFGWLNHQVSESWKKIIERQQEGFATPLSRSDRLRIVGIGASFSARSKARTYAFLRKGTVSFRTPASPILDPFWATEKRTSILNIRNNYLRKLKGERI